MNRLNSRLQQGSCSREVAAGKLEKKSFDQERAASFRNDYSFINLSRGLDLKVCYILLKCPIFVFDRTSS